MSAASDHTPPRSWRDRCRQPVRVAVIAGSIAGTAVGFYLQEDALNRVAANEHATSRLAAGLAATVNTLVCNLTTGAWKERGEIIDGLVVAAIKEVKATRAKERAGRDFLATFGYYHYLLRKELDTAVGACPNG